MELVSELPNIQLYIPAAIVVVAVTLIYVFGFKPAEQPPFDKLSSGAGDDRKTVGKKRKTKDRKTLNGHVANLTDGKNEKSPAKEKESKRSPTKEPTTPKQQKEKRQDNNASKQAEKNKKNELTKPKKNETLEEIKNKKNTKKLLNEKPLDYDDDSWETVPSKFDKKKKQESPVKKSKKDNKKVEKLVEIEKLVKEEVNKELREKEKVIKVEVVNSNETPKKEALSSTVIDAAVEEKKEKKKEKKQQKNKAEKQEPQTVVAQSKPIEKIIEQPSIKKTIDIEAPKKVEPVTDGIVAFDELGDVWKEAKVPKKSKKKARRDN